MKTSWYQISNLKIQTKPRKKLKIFLKNKNPPLSLTFHEKNENIWKSKKNTKKLQTYKKYLLDFKIKKKQISLKLSSLTKQEKISTE